MLLWLQIEEPLLRLAAALLFKLFHALLEPLVDLIHLVVIIVEKVLCQIQLIFDALFDDSCFLRGPLSPYLGDLMILEHLLPELAKFIIRQFFEHLGRRDLFGRERLIY